MVSSYPLLLLITLVSFVRAFPQASPSFSNATTTGLGKSETTSVCCFVIQDIVSEEWFQETSYSSTQSLVNLTSITTLLTVYPNTTKTAYETHVTTTNHEFTFSYLVGINPITDLSNAAPGPSQTANVIVNQTAVVTGGVTVQSPAAFYVYNTVKVITAAAVTDSNGQVMCGTTSSFASPNAFNSKYPDPTFANMNGNAQAYFGGYGIVSASLKPTQTETMTATYTISEIDTNSKTNTFTDTYTLTNTDYTQVYVDSKGDIVTPGPKPSAVVISLVTPFIYQPSRGSKGQTGEGDGCLQTDGTENYGYVPQTLVDFLGSNAIYQSQYPGLESCLPGGPSILKIGTCTEVAPTSLIAGGDLTSSTVNYITPAAAMTTNGPAPAPKPTTTSSSTDTWPTTQQPATQLVSSTDTTWPTTQKPATQLAPSTETTWPTTQKPATQLVQSTDTTRPTTQQPATQLISTDTWPTTQQPATRLVSTSTDTWPTTQQPATQLAPQPQPAPAQADNSPAAPVSNFANPASPTAAIGSIVNSIIGGGAPTTSTPVVIPAATTIPVANAPAGLTGSSTTISGTPFIVVPSATTVLLPASSSLVGLGITTTINGTPVLQIASTTTVPLPSAGLPQGLNGFITTISGSSFVVINPTTVAILSTSTLPGQLTTISGTTDLVFTAPTTVPVISGVSLSGSMTVVNGVTEVAISAPTTIAVGTGFVGVVGNTTTSGFVQITGGVGRNSMISWWFGASVGVVGFVVLGG